MADSLDTSHVFAAENFGSTFHRQPMPKRLTNRKVIFKMLEWIAIAFLSIFAIYSLVEFRKLNDQVMELQKMSGENKYHRKSHNESLKQLQYTISRSDLVPRTCAGYKKTSGHGFFTIDPMKQKHEKTKFKAHCDFESGLTIITHDKPEKIDVDTCEGEECFNIGVDYNVTFGNINSLLLASRECHQDIIFDCTSTEFTNFASWTDGNGNHHRINSSDKINSCQCHLNNTCVFKAQQHSISCNCDYKDSSPQQDVFSITSKEQLPVKYFHYSQMGSKPYHHATVQIGPLICKGIDPCFGTYNFLNDPRRNIEFDSDSTFYDSQKCYPKVDSSNAKNVSCALDWKGNGWYRFMPPAGRNLQTSKSSHKRCGLGKLNVLLNGTNFPEHENEATEIEVCFGDDDSNCSEFRNGFFSTKVHVQVKNCGPYNIYYLTDVFKYGGGRFCGQ